MTHFNLTLEGNMNAWYSSSFKLWVTIHFSKMTYWVLMGLIVSSTDDVIILMLFHYKCHFLQQLKPTAFRFSFLFAYIWIFYKELDLSEYNVIISLSFRLQVLWHWYLHSNTTCVAEPVQNGLLPTQRP